MTAMDNELLDELETVFRLHGRAVSTENLAAAGFVAPGQLLRLKLVLRQGGAYLPAGPLARRLRDCRYLNRGGCPRRPGFSAAQANKPAGRGQASPLAPTW